MFPIGSRLKTAREAIGYTQRMASQASGIGESSISEYENGRREPKFSQLSKLADAYKKPVEFFLSEQEPPQAVMLWRDPPDKDVMKKTEAEFQQLCQQYHNIEALMDELGRLDLPAPPITDPAQFSYETAELFAKKVQDRFRLGDVPIASLKQILEQTYYVKIFYLNFVGSAVSTVSEQFGPAILLNARNKQWRRSYDLAHELFHILTWNVFRSKRAVETEDEDRLANAFASRLLMPEESIKDRLRSNSNKQGQISFDKLDDIAREFDVSLQALIYRIATICRFKREEAQRLCDAADRYTRSFRPRESQEPRKLPERYCDLAVRALREGKLSLMQFKHYMGIPYREAEQYLMDNEGFTDEEISIPVA